MQMMNRIRYKVCSLWSDGKSHRFRIAAGGGNKTGALTTRPDLRENTKYPWDLFVLEYEET